MIKINQIQFTVSRMAIVLLMFAVSAASRNSVDAQDKVAKNPRVPATVKGYQSAALFSKVGGYLESVSVDIGDEVIRGQILAVIDVPEMAKQMMQKEKRMALAEAEKNQASAKIDEAKSHLDALQAQVAEAGTMRSQKQALYDFERTECVRIERLAASGSIQMQLLDSAKYKMSAAQSELGAVDARVATAKANLSGGNAAVRSAEADAAAAEAKVGVAQADFEYTKQLMDYATIRAPWDGKVTERMFDPGAFVQSAEGNSAAKPILHLVRDDKVRVTFSLGQKDLAGLKKGVPVTLSEIDALPGKKFEGTVSRYSAELDAETRMMRVEMEIDNPEGKLKSGFFGYATVHYSK